MRALTAGEIALARSVFRDRIGYRGVRIARGAGINAAAAVAFAKGNSAITLRNTIYFKSRNYSDDFSLSGDRSTFIHELTHVWQWARLGSARFLLRYARDLAAARFRPGDMYRYGEGTPFDGAMLEAQAQMVGDYVGAVGGRKRIIAANLEGTGFHDL